MDIMQNTLGERLQKARQRLGLSIDDVASKIKIRKSILIKFESNEFDIDLPAIYRRGFFKAYVKILQLNVDNMMADYTIVTGDHKVNNNFSIGHIKLEEPDLDDEENSADVDFKQEQTSANFVKPVPWFVHFKLLKIGIVSLILLFVLSACVRVFRKPSVEKVKPQVTVVPEVPVVAVSDIFFDVIASADVQVFIRQEQDRKRLFAGTMKKGERQSFTSAGPAQISYSEGNSVVIEPKNASPIKPQKGGRGWIRLD